MRKNYSRVPFDESPIFGLSLVVGAVGLMLEFGILKPNFEPIFLFMERNSLLLGQSLLLFTSFFINLMFLSAVLRLATTSTVRGIRLNRVANNYSIVTKPMVTRVVLYIGTFLLVKRILPHFEYEQLFTELLVRFQMQELIVNSMSLTLAVLLLLPWRAPRFRNLVPSRLRRFPRKKNSIVLGSIFENSREIDWLIVRLRSLNANILITGSIGSGKSQSGILPIVDQLSKSLSVRPSILFIDPKRSMTDEIEEILKKNLSRVSA